MDRVRVRHAAAKPCPVECGGGRRARAVLLQVGAFDLKAGGWGPCTGRRHRDPIPAAALVTPPPPPHLHCQHGDREQRSRQRDAGGARGPERAAGGVVAAVAAAAAAGVSEWVGGWSGVSWGLRRAPGRRSAALATASGGALATHGSPQGRRPPRIAACGPSTCRAWRLLHRMRPACHPGLRRPLHCHSAAARTARRPGLRRRWAAARRLRPAPE
jgi:hypothetical protein